MARKFQLKSNFSPKGDQPKAIQTLLNGIEAGEKYQTLVGVTGVRQNIYSCKCYRKESKTKPDYGS